MATKPQQESTGAERADGKRGDSNATGGPELQLDQDLDSLFAEALAATEKRAARSRADREGEEHPERADADSEEEEEEENSLRFDIEDEAGEIESVQSLEDQLNAALQEDDEADDSDLQREMEKLLSSSFGLSQDLSDDDPDLAFPEIVGEEGDEEILAAGDDSAAGAEIVSESEIELERARAQLAELAQLLSLRDLELRTAEERVEVLESQVVAVSRQATGVAREFESFRRRSERDRADQAKFAGEKIIKEFLGIYDNLERALSHSGAERKTPLAQGVDMTLSQFTSALKRCGVERVASDQDTQFDPSFHEAVGQEHDPEVPAGNVLTELQPGFVLNGRLLRAAMVTVSRGPAAPPKQTGGKKAAGKKTGAKKAAAKKTAAKKTAAKKTAAKKTAAKKTVAKKTTGGRSPSAKPSKQGKKGG